MHPTVDTVIRALENPLALKGNVTYVTVGPRLATAIVRSGSESSWSSADSDSGYSFDRRRWGFEIRPLLRALEHDANTQLPYRFGDENRGFAFRYDKPVTAEQLLERIRQYCPAELASLR